MQSRAITDIADNSILVWIIDVWNVLREFEFWVQHIQFEIYYHANYNGDDWIKFERNSTIKSIIQFNSISLFSKNILSIVSTV